MRFNNFIRNRHNTCLIIIRTSIQIGFDHRLIREKFVPNVSHVGIGQIPTFKIFTRQIVLISSYYAFSLNNLHVH